MNKLSWLGFALVLSMVAAFPAFGQVVTTGIETGLSDAQTGISTIGALMLTVAGAGIAFRWILGFLFG